MAKINIYAFSRHHMFQTAENLHRQGHEVTLITAYPTKIAKKYVSCKIKSTNLELLRLGSRRMFGETKLFYLIELVLFILHSAAVSVISRPASSNIYSADLFPFMFIDARHKFWWVMDRGSTHYRTHQKITNKIGFIHDFKRYLSEKDYDFSDVIVVPSLFVAESFSEFSQKVVILPYSTDPTIFNPKIRRANNPQPRVLFVGTANFRKGFDKFAELSKLLKTISLEQVGGKTSIHPGNVMQHGHIKEYELAKLYDEVDIVCLLSREEGQSLSLLQALSLKIPIIVTKQCGVEEFIDETTGVVLPDVSEITDVTFLAAVECCLNMRATESSYAMNPNRIKSWEDRAIKLLECCR